MLTKIIDFSLHHRAFVILTTLAIAIGGGIAVRHMDIDAFPDTTPVQVQINTVVPSLGPEEVETQVTSPIEQALSGLPKLRHLRSLSKFGMSQVVVIFEDGVDIYFARQLIAERLNTVKLSSDIERPKLGPVSTGLGEVFHYIVTGQGDDETELRTIHDWVIRPAMRTVPGTAEINTWGGFEKQFQIRVDPERLVKHGLTFDEVAEAVRASNRNVGGGSITQPSGMLLVHGVARTVNLEEIRGVVIKAIDGVPLRIGDVADVTIGHEIRRGAVTADGRGEVVLGLGFMLMGENSHEVTWSMKNKLEDLKKTLPANVNVLTVYDRTELVEFVIDTVRKNLFEGGLLVIAVLFAFLGNLRAAAIVALAIPLSMLFAFSGMLQYGIAASLLSLGAIDFGMIVDSSVVMVENCVRKLAEGQERRVEDEANSALAPPPTTLGIIRDAAVEVRRPTMFGEFIIMIVYLPILTLEGIEGKLFRPMALTVIFALVGSMILSLTLMPVLASLLLPRRIEEREPLLMRIAHRIHFPVLQFSMHHKTAVIAFALAVLTVTYGMIAPNLGSEFVPRLSEGSLVLGLVRLPGTDISESVRGNSVLEKLLLEEFPDEIQHVWSRVGTAEIATDPMGTELTDMFISLKPRSEWKKATTQDELTALIEDQVRHFQGVQYEVLQPIEHRVNEMISGSRSQLAVKLFGDDFTVLQQKGAEIGDILRGIPGNADVYASALAPQSVLQIKVRQEELARYGVQARQVLQLVESVGGLPLSEVVQGQLRFPLVIRLPDRHRASPEAIGAMQLRTASGERLPLSRLADISIVESPSTIRREWGQRCLNITCNVRGRDLGSFVNEVQQRIAKEVTLPTGRYRIEYGGQFENLIRAERRLMIVVPIALALIFTLLYFTYHNFVDAARVFTGVPFAWVGGIIALWIRDMPFSISAGIGFIAMSGVAVLDDMILVSYVRQLRERGLSLDDAVSQAAVTRLRPVLMTTLVAALGFLPMAFNTGMGAEVQRPLATVVIGGVIGAMIMSLLVLRVLYMIFSAAFERAPHIKTSVLRESEPEIRRGENVSPNSLPRRLAALPTPPQDLTERNLP